MDGETNRTHPTSQTHQSMKLFMLHVLSCFCLVFTAVRHIHPGIFENPSHGIYLRYTFSTNLSQLFWHSGPGTDHTDALFPISMEKCKKFDYRNVGALLNLYRITRFVMSHVFHFLHFVISGCSFAAHFKPPVRRGRRTTTFRLQIVIPQIYFTCSDGSKTRVILSEPQREAKSRI